MQGVSAERELASVLIAAGEPGGGWDGGFGVWLVHPRTASINMLRHPGRPVCSTAWNLLQPGHKDGVCRPEGGGGADLMTEQAGCP